ncbi:hypothetical protein SLEP1_g14339 [Rubroshorea leprosula]|uniref:Uncharacterized protein n=1 Tax=Rubroshorea leprosula TaxID=152421 RepID=A0AAV5IIR6_9ROSI|nr:hypothetical protein SLEP1_g14339 [Rubroshorea leprosula]
MSKLEDLKVEGIWIRMSFFSCSFSSFFPSQPCVFLLFFSPLQLPKSPLQAAGTSFEKLVRKLGISPSFLSKNLIWNPEIFPPCWKFQICLALLVFTADCYVGG